MVDIPTLYTLYLKSAGVTIDTRHLQDGEIFFALPGSHTDGHNFIQEAFEKGASYVIGEKPFPHKRYFQVSNSLKALQELAAYHRKQLSPKAVIAITGSNGKTTTKTITTMLFKSIGKTFSTPGNWNNHLGLPLTLLKTPSNVEYLILELGDNQPGDITFLTSLCKPTLVAITNISHDHIGIYGSPKANFEGKMEGVHYAFEHKLPIIAPSYPANDLFPQMPDYHQWLQNKLHDYPHAYTTGNKTGDLRINPIESKETSLIIHLRELKHWNQESKFEIPLWGLHNCYNVGMALAIFSHYYHWNKELLQHTLKLLNPVPNRGEILKTQHITWILDAYNANPISMRYAIHFFLITTKGRKGLILGAMDELGKFSQKEHELLAEWLSAHNKAHELAFIYLIGNEMIYFKNKWKNKNVPIYYFKSIEEIIQNIKTYINDPTTILLKGSRSYHLEDIYLYFKSLFTDTSEKSQDHPKI